MNVLTLATTSIDDHHFSDLSELDQQAVTQWINENLIPRKTQLLNWTSYGLKHILDHDMKIYVTNHQFKEAMLLCGFQPVDPNELRWSYCLSKKSPAFRK